MKLNEQELEHIHNLICIRLMKNYGIYYKYKDIIVFSMIQESCDKSVCYGFKWLNDILDNLYRVSYEDRINAKIDVLSIMICADKIMEYIGLETKKEEHFKRFKATINERRDIKFLTLISNTIIRVNIFENTKEYKILTNFYKNYLEM